MPDLMRFRSMRIKKLKRSASNVVAVARYKITVTVGAYNRTRWNWPATKALSSN